MAVTRVGKAGTGSGNFDIKFGVDSVSDSGSDSTITSYTQNETQEVKELRGKTGQVVGAVFHKKKQDITIEFVGAPALSVAIGSNQHGTTYDGSACEEILVDEVTTDISSEGHRTTNVKCTGYFQSP